MKIPMKIPNGADTRINGTAVEAAPR